MGRVVDTEFDAESIGENRMVVASSGLSYAFQNVEYLADNVFRVAQASFPSLVPHAWYTCSASQYLQSNGKYYSFYTSEIAV